MQASEQAATERALLRYIREMRNYIDTVRQDTKNRTFPPETLEAFVEEERLALAALADIRKQGVK